jgi:hypothetical protein
MTWPDGQGFHGGGAGLISCFYAFIPAVQDSAFHQSGEMC